MTAVNTTASIWRPLVFGVGVAMALVAVCAIVMALTWTVLVSSQDSLVFAESQPASQQDSLEGSDVAPGGGAEDAVLDPTTADPATETETNGIAAWLTRMAIGLSSDSAVSYLAYVYSVAPPDQMSTTPTWAISE